MTKHFDLLRCIGVVTTRLAQTELDFLLEVKAHFESLKP